MKPTATPAALAAAASGHLTAADAALVSRCDGHHDLTALSGALALDRPALLDRLDALADAGMLTARVAPPTGVSRRSLLGGVLGASAVAAVGVALPRLAQAKPGEQDPLPAKCYEPNALDLELALPSDLLAGQDPADLLRIASKLEFGALEASIDTGDAATLELKNATDQLADLADAHASLLLEAASDGYLEYTAAAALGDSGPLGREGDVYSRIADSSRRFREQEAKQRGSEARRKDALSAHDEQACKTFDKREGAKERDEKAMTYPEKVGASEKQQKKMQMESVVYAKKVYPALEAARKKDRLADEMNQKKMLTPLFDDTAGKEKIAYFSGRVEEATKKLQSSGDALDSRQLTGAFEWATAPLELKRRLQEQDYKKAARQTLKRELERGTSEELAKGAVKDVAQREKQLAQQAKKKASEMQKKQQQAQTQV
jgi:hypothetical protein